MGRRLLYGVIASVIVLTVFGLGDSPYDRVGPGPAIAVGSPGGGSWSVTTARVRDSNWFQWLGAEITGERTIRPAGQGSGEDAGAAPEVGDAMATAQTRAVLVAAQLAARRNPVGAAGLQVAEVTASARDTGLKTGDIMLAAGRGGDLLPLRAPADLETAVAGRRSPQVLVVPRISGDVWGSAELREMPAARLAGVRAGPRVSATAHRLGPVEGASAGLVLALARVDALTPGDLTGGRRVTGTGEIGLSGNVSGVGEVALKVDAAAEARMDVFFVPFSQRREAVAAARDTGVRVVPVRTVPEAVGWLCSTGGRAPVC
ncbi:hypothetical protein E1281_36080 [Actinomadura sp. KC345]|uniref:S16 family serine protease n=1 Tax=Actinomadura sp. KC345 TaxID=2530371 RepID=UPI0010493DB1|nr:S16 family serine protease [Actinomadura sp. KC345]TDC42552.1 hypothetical protein E1281_36080 [Actinomadura sp. KC345]